MTERHRRPVLRILPAWLAALLLVATAAGTTGWPQSSPSCATFELPGTIVLPHGGSYDGRYLELCLIKQQTAEIGWYEASIDGVAYGVYLGRSVSRDATCLEEECAVFAKEGPRAIRLVGYARPDARPAREIQVFFGSRYHSIRHADLSELSLHTAGKDGALVRVAAIDTPPIEALHLASSRH